jgi:hypothetical protein
MIVLQWIGLAVVVSQIVLIVISMFVIDLHHVDGESE